MEALDFLDEVMDDETENDDDIFGEVEYRDDEDEDELDIESYDDQDDF